MKKIIIFIFIILISSCHNKIQKLKSKRINKIEVTKEVNRDVDLDGVADYKDMDMVEKKMSGPKVTSAVGSGSNLKSEQVVNINKKLKTTLKKNNNLQKETKDIKIGNVLYLTPDTMIVLIESKVIVRISKDKNVENITSDLSGKANIVPINITNKMEVKLIDPSSDKDPSFTIKSVNKSEQEVDDETYTEWEFTVVPLKKGKHELKLVISIFRDGVSKEQVWSDTIEVKSNVSKKVLTFWEEYWQWLMTTFIIPIFLFFWKRRNGKKED